MSTEHVPPSEESEKHTSDVLEKASSTDSYEGPLDGGRDAWMTVGGGWLFYFCGLGLVFSFWIATPPLLIELLQILQFIWVREFPTFVS